MLEKKAYFKGMEKLIVGQSSKIKEVLQLPNLPLQTITTSEVADRFIELLIL